MMNIKIVLKNLLLFVINAKRITANITYSAPNNLLLGKKIIVTGGGRGLGASMAKKFIEEGADVLIAGRNEETLKKTAERIGCHYLPLDVSDISSFEHFITNANEIMGGVTGLVNNAGISLHEQTFFDVTPESFDKQMNTNLKGGLFLTQILISFWKKNKQFGNILFVSSETGDTMDYRPYGLSKVAINSLVQGLAYLFAKDGIRVNAVAPGVTSSDMTGINPNEGLYVSCNLTERAYLPKEVAEVSCFLMSETSGCISGQIITCNNGTTINARWK